MESRAIVSQFILLVVTFHSLSERSNACEQRPDLRIEAGSKCNSTGSVVLLHGQPCLITNTIDVPVDTVIEYNEFFCMGTDFDDIQLEGWSTSKSIKSHTPRNSVLQFVTPGLNNATGLGQSQTYYRFSGQTFVTSNVVGEIINITWADYVMSKWKSVFSNVHRCQLRGITVTVTGGATTSFLSFALVNLVLLFTSFCLH